MKIEDIEVGMKVRINSNSILITHRRHDSCGEMQRMKGKVFEVTDVRPDRVRIKGFIWAPEDLDPLEPIHQDPQIFHFDANNL